MTPSKAKTKVSRESRTSRMAREYAYATTIIPEAIVVIVVTAVLACIFLLFNALAAEYSSAKADTRSSLASYVPHVEYEYKRHGDWTIVEVSDGKTHRACVATRQVKPGVKVSVVLSQDNMWSLGLSGVSFEQSNRTDYALLQIDSGDPMEVLATTDSQTSDTTNTTVFSLPSDVSELKKLSSGSILTVMVAARRYKLQLKDTAKIVPDLQTCNSTAQARVSKRRISSAAPAKEST